MGDVPVAGIFEVVRVGLLSGGVNCRAGECGPHRPDEPATCFWPVGPPVACFDAGDDPVELVEGAAAPDRLESAFGGDLEEEVALATRYQGHRCREWPAQLW